MVTSQSTWSLLNVMMNSPSPAQWGTTASLFEGWGRDCCVWQGSFGWSSWLRYHWHNLNSQENPVKIQLSWTGPNMASESRLEPIGSVLWDPKFERTQSWCYHEWQRHRRTRRPMLEGQSAAYAEQILSAASYCHQRGPSASLRPRKNGQNMPKSKCIEELETSLNIHHHARLI